MWKEIRVKRNDNGRLYYRSGIERIDGFKIIRVDTTRWNIETFLCQGNFDDFYFDATRQGFRDGNDESTSEILDFYTVRMKSSITILKGNTPKNQELLLTNIIDVEEALLHYIAPNFTKHGRVKQVLFNIEPFGQPPVLKKANEFSQ